MIESPPVDFAPRLQHMDALPAGTRLGEFEIQGLLGVGGFGMVYQAFDHSLRRAVAIKEYMPCALAGRAQGQSLWVRTAGDAQTFQAGLASFVKEAQLLAQFDHPSLVKVFRIWEANNTAYMVMPLYVGMTLKQARAQMCRPPSEAWLRQLLWPVLGALRVLHEAHTLHRDISPDNLFLQDNGPPVLLDLGAARHAISDAERQHTAVLKVNYAPIEQYGAEAACATGEDALALRQGPWSDLYSLGAVVYGCVCNDTPLPATLRALRDRMVRFRRVAKTVRRQFGIEYSPGFVHAISETLHLQPSARPQNIDAFLALLDMSTAPTAGQPFHWREALEFSDPDGDVPTVIDGRDDEVAPTRFMESVMDREAVDVEIGVDLLGAHGSAGPAPEDARHTVQLGQDGGAEDAPQDAWHHAPAEAPEYAGDEGAARRRGARAWVGVLAAVALVGGAAWWGLRAPAVPGGERDEIITEWATTPAASVQPASLEAPPSETVLSAHEAPAVGAEPGARSGAEAPAARPAAAARKGSVRAAAPASAPAVAPAPATAAPDPELAPVRAPAVPRPRVAAPVQGPTEACADAGFLARPMCIHQECQKPAQLGHPVCVENRRRQEAEAQSREFNGR